jgi:hypothetical protein
MSRFVCRRKKKKKRNFEVRLEENHAVEIWPSYSAEEDRFSVRFLDNCLLQVMTAGWR